MSQRSEGRVEDALQKIERVRQARRGRFYLRDEQVTLSHGSGGKATHNLIEGLLAKTLSNPLLDVMDDAATFDLDGATGASRVAFTTDSYVVSPVFFPGGDIGRLAVNGTVNDLSAVGAEPLYLSVGLILEEGLEFDALRRIVESMREAADAAGVKIVTGDTKVVHRGKADKIFINTAGIGVVRRPVDISLSNARPGDKLLVSGYVGDHGIAIMLAREALEMEADIQSDTAPLNGLVQAILDVTAEIHCLKDPTRGGVATSLNEIAIQSEVAIAVDEEAVPVRPEVRGACEILGLDPLHIANEGKLLAVAPAVVAERVLAAMREHPLGRDAAIIGEVLEDPQGMVIVRTSFGGSRVLDMLVGDPLPRIC